MKLVQLLKKYDLTCPASNTCKKVIITIFHSQRTFLNILWDACKVLLHMCYIKSLALYFYCKSIRSNNIVTRQMIHFFSSVSSSMRRNGGQFERQSIAGQRMGLGYSRIILFLMKYHYIELAGSLYPTEPKIHAAWFWILMRSSTNGWVIARSLCFILVLKGFAR